jgi:hypothetical protein
MPYVAERAPAGGKSRHERQTVTSESGDYGPHEDADVSDNSPATRTYRKAWAHMSSKVYEIDPMVCPKCGSEMKVMKVIAVIQEPEKIKRILQHLVKQGRPPPGLDPASLNYLSFLMHQSTGEVCSFTQWFWSL